MSHAIGLGESLSANGVSTEIVSGAGSTEYFSSCTVNEVKAGTNGVWLYSLLNKLKEICKQEATDEKTILVRYSSSNSWLISLCLQKLCNKNSVKFGFEINSLAYHQLLGAPLLIRRLLLKIECKVLERADFCYVVSEQIKEDITGATTNGSLASAIVVVPNGGPNVMQAGAVRSDSKSCFKFIFFGIYQEYYDIEVVLEAFSQLSEQHDNIELHFFGDGPKLSSIKKAAERNAKIVEHGRYKLDKLVKTQLTSENTALLLPFSDKSENQIRSPIKLFEYMCVGLPIVASDCSQISDVLTNRHDGLLVPNSDVLSWVRNMEMIFQDSTLRLNLQRNVVETYSAHTWQSRATTLYNFMKNLEIPRH